MTRVLSMALAVAALVTVVAGCGTAHPMTSVSGGSVSSTTTTGVTSTESVPAAASSTAPVRRVSFVVPIGEGGGQITYMDMDKDPWGPNTFCVLPDKSVAILDAGDQRIELFDSAGSFLRSIDLAGIVLSPEDMRWWKGAFAILETNSPPHEVIVVDGNGAVRQKIEIPVEILALPGSGALRIGRRGELEVQDGTGSPLPITDAQGNTLSMAEIAGIAAAREAAAVQWEPEFPITGKAKRLGWDASGNNYFEVICQYESADGRLTFDRVVVRLDTAYQQAGLTRVPYADFVLFPLRMIDLTDDGNAYSMVPMADGVHVEMLEFSASLP